jgi:hypothetical protein
MSRSGSHLGIPINIKNTKFVKDLPMIDAHFRFNQCNSFREEYITTNMIKAKLYMNVHWMVLYKLYVFCSDMKFKMVATAGLSLTLDPMGKMFQNASSLKPNCPGMIIGRSIIKKPEALKSLYRSPGYKKNQLVLCKNYVLQW